MKFEFSKDFKDQKFLEMVEMLKAQTKNPDVKKIIEKYGQGFDVIYFNGRFDAKIEIAQNLLREGFDDEVISRNTGISIAELKKFKRKL